jgi:hypothetical protein
VRVEYVCTLATKSYLAFTGVDVETYKTLVLFHRIIVLVEAQRFQKTLPLSALCRQDRQHFLLHAVCATVPGAMVSSAATTTHRAHSKRLIPTRASAMLSKKPVLLRTPPSSAPLRAPYRLENLAPRIQELWRAPPPHSSMVQRTSTHSLGAMSTWCPVAMAAFDSCMK